jgi:hypothetical protein
LVPGSDLKRGATNAAVPSPTAVGFDDGAVAGGETFARGHVQAVARGGLGQPHERGKGPNDLRPVSAPYRRFFAPFVPHVLANGPAADPDDIDGHDLTPV